MEVTAASPISELELSRAAAWAGEVAEKPLLAAVGRGSEGGTADQTLIPEACLKVISQKEEGKRTCFVSSFFFFLKKCKLVHNVPSYQHLILCVASSPLNIMSFCSLA